MKIFLLLFSVGLLAGDVPPAARSVIHTQETIHESGYKQARNRYETWEGCSEVLDYDIGQGYRHLVCVRTYIAER